MLFDHVEPIRRARDELEACNQKEQLMVRLKDLLSRQMESISIGGESVAPVGQQDSPDSILYQELARLRSQQQRMEARLLHINKDHNERMNRLKANIGGRLKVGERNFQQTKHELSKRLRSSEAQRIESARQLEVRKAPLTARDSSIASIRPYMEQLMSLNEDLQHQVQESDEALLRTRRELEGSREHKVCLEVQLGEVQAQILELQRRRDIMDLHDGEKSNDELETKISELQEKLSSTAMQVDTREQRAEQLHSDLEHVRAELFGFEQLMVRLREQGIHDRILISSCTDEVNVLKQTNTASRETIEPLDLEGGTEEDTQSDLDSQLDSQQEQHQQLGHVCGQQGGLAEFTNNMSELNDCLLQIRDRQHEKNIQLDLEISRLRSPMFAPQQSSTLFDAFSFSLVLHFINK
ncbi:polyamine-modulated factor 1-binding protein 1-like [Drosophila obscura]|uniref:polyamine-modulated factor 1-binding protein 1-like n=1 Tax=Drosophila obscura TaxID=7282 RepID=UPI001BB0DF79|nr:polyamine-modulated factor 1-binding protein 1-like [Drosophila obscura]